MSDFIPPYPKRLQKLPGPIELLKLARRDLLSIWPESTYERQFIQIKLLNRSLAIANHPEIVRYTLVDNHANYQRKSGLVKKLLAPLIGDNLFISDGDQWARRRAVEAPLLAAHIKANSCAAIANTVDEWRQKWAGLDGDDLEVLPEMKQWVATVLCRFLFDEAITVAKVNGFTESFADYLASIEQLDLNAMFGLPNWLSGKKPSKADGAIKRIHDWVDDIIAEQISDKTKTGLLSGYLGVLSDNRSNPGLSQEQIRNSLIGFYLAGHETTANTLAWAWYLISQCPEVEQTLHAELDGLGEAPATVAKLDNLVYTVAVIKETLRLYPPLPLLIREAAADDTIRNRAVPAGSLLLVAPWLLHRHKLYWDKPDHFIPERFLPDAPSPKPFSYIPFGVGARACLGEELGLQIMALCLAGLAKNFRLEAAKGYMVQPVTRLMLRPNHAMPMRLVLRSRPE